MSDADEAEVVPGLVMPCPACDTDLRVSIGLFLTAADGSTGTVAAHLGDVEAQVLSGILDTQDEAGDDRG